MAQVVDAAFVSTSQLLCDVTQVWSDEDGATFSTASTSFSLLAGGTAVAMQGSDAFDFVFINKAPAFAARNLVVDGAARNYSEPWLLWASPGMLNGSDVADESSQNTSFVIEALPAAFFLEPPTVQDGRLAFTVAGSLTGVATIRVALVDDGGSANGGVNSSGVQSYSVQVLQYEKAPSFAMVRNLTVHEHTLESSGFFEVQGFLRDVQGPPGDLVQRVRLSLSFPHGNASLALFSRPPEIFLNGSLLFALAPWEYGEVTVTVTLAAGEAESVANLSLVVAPVNQPPSFELSGAAAAELLSLLEGSGEYIGEGLAVNISKGPPVDNEDYQAVSFETVLVDGSADLFVPLAPRSRNCSAGAGACLGQVNASLVHVSANGSVSLRLAPYQHGSAVFETRLVDDGTTENGGSDTSPPARFNVTVLPVNSPPTFAVEHVEVWEGTGNVLLRGVAVNISAGSPTGDEDWQRVSFAVWLVEDAHSLFDSNLTLDANGTLSVTLRAFANGEATVGVALVDDGGTARGGANSSGAQNLTVSVLAVNQAPSFSLPSLLEFVETDPDYAQAGLASAISRGSPTGNENDQNVTFSVVLSNVSGWISGGPAVSLSAEGDVEIRFAPFEYGTATYQVSLADDGGTARGGSNTSETHTLRIVRLPVNNPPSFQLAPRVRVLEGSGASALSQVATSISRGSPIGNEDHQNVTFSWRLRNGSMLLFAYSERVELSPEGNLSFSLAPYRFGSAVLEFTLTDDGGTDNGGVNASAPRALTLQVDPVNDPPTFSIAPLVRVLVGTNYSSARGEAGTEVVSNISAGSPNGNEDHQRLSFSVAVTNGSLGLLAAPLQIAPDGELTFVANEFDYGWVHFNVSLADDGGTADGGRNVSEALPFAVHVVFVNHAPSFHIEEPHVVAWEGADTLVAGFVSNISKGSPTGSEDWQALTFVLDIVSSSAPILDPSNLTISPDGDLLFSLAAFENGFATVAVTLVDDGGTERGGENASAVATFNVTVLPVNNAPEFTLPGPVEAAEGAGLVSRVGVAASISAGAPNGNEDVQNLTFRVQFAGGNTALFASPTMAMDDTGTLAFELAPFEFGTATLSVTLEDDGGTERGGANTSAAQTLTVTVLPVNDAPTFNATGHTAWEDDGHVVIAGLASDIRAGPPLPIANEDDQVLWFEVSLRNGSLPLFAPYSFAACSSVPNPSNASNASNASCVQGFVQTMAEMTPGIASRVRMWRNGSMAFRLADDEFGEARLGLQLVDDGGTSNGGSNRSAVVEVTVTVLPVNDAPSFDMGGGDCLGGIIPFGCSEAAPTVIVRRNAFLVGESYTLSSFVAAVSTGPPNEVSQTVSYEVFQAGGAALLDGDPSVSSDGTLQLTQLPDAVGEAQFWVRVADSGGTERGGVNVSGYQMFRVVVVSGVVEASVVLGVNASQFAAEAFVDAVSRAVSAPRERIAISSVTSVELAGSRRLLALSGVQVGVQVFLLTDDPAVLQDVAVLLTNLTALPMVESVNATLAPVDESDTATFDLVSPDISVYEDQGPHVILAVTNIFSVNSQLDASGNQIVHFTAVQVNGTNASSLFSSAPVVTSATCRFNETCSTTISFATQPTRNGETWYLVRQLGSSVIRALRVTVLPINQAPTFSLTAFEVVLDEDTALWSLPAFAANISRGPDDEAAQVMSFQLVAVASSGPLFFDGTPMPVEANMSDWLVQTAAIDPADGSLHVGLVPFAIGNVTFQVTLVDDGGVVLVPNASVLGDDTSAPLNFTVAAVRVNHAPSFVLPDDALQVAEDCAPVEGGSCRGASFSMPGFAQAVAAGPPNEAVQALSFTVTPLDCQVPRFSAGAWRNASDLYSAGCPPDLTFPGMSRRFERLFSAPVDLSPNGTMSFALVADRHGIVRFSVWLRDDGGLLRGGEDLSATGGFSVEILRVNDAPSFDLATTAISLNQDCMGYSPTPPYPNGWTWSTDAAVCAVEQGEGNFREGCWTPLWSCAYSPLQLGSTSRRLLSAHTNASGVNATAEPACNSTLFPRCECDARPNCSCPCENATFWAEVLLVGYNRSQLIANQLAVRVAIVAAFEPLRVEPQSVMLHRVQNLSAIPYEKQAQRALLSDEGHAVSVLFSLPLLFDLSETAFFAGVAEQLRATLVGAGVPEVAVVGWEAAAGSANVESQAALCTAPEPPPRVQCQDGAYVLEELVQRVRSGGWGEEQEDIWFVVERISGSGIGSVDVRFPVRNVSRNAIFSFVPLDGRFGAAQYNITIFDSGGTANGGVDHALASSPLQVTVVGQNLPPAFELPVSVLLYTQDSACVETAGGGCAGLCTGGDSLCVGGPDDAVRCDAVTGCGGNCSGGAFIPVTISCQGTCSCPVVTDGGAQVVVPTCDSLGLCSCEAPNSGARCFNSSQCTGGGACADVGMCTAPADDGGNCTRGEQCSNGAECSPVQQQYLRHLHRGRAVGITAGSENEDGGDSCPPGTTVGNGCALQSVTFSVVATNLTRATDIFAELPELDAAGVLTFNLTAGAFGAVDFEVTLRDDSGDAASDTSPTQVLTIVIDPVNALPSFDLPDTVTVLEDSGEYARLVALNIVSPNSIGIITVISFDVVPRSPSLFAQQPQIDEDGVLTFTPAPDAFGQSSCEVTLVDLSRPQAGDARVTKTLTIIVQPVNDMPTMTLVNTEASFSLAINAGPISAPLFGDIQPGPANEFCAANGPGCESQSVSFIVVGIDNPLLFLWFPSIDAGTGEITFRAKPDATGSARVTLGVIDDGFELSSQQGCVPLNATSFLGVYGNGADAPCLVDPSFEQAGQPSLLTTFGVEVVPEGNRNDLKVIYEVNCSGLAHEANCTCPPLTESTVDDNLVPKAHPVCSLLSGAVADDFLPTRAQLVVEGDQGAREVENFAEVVREDDYLAASLAVFSVAVAPSSTVAAPAFELDFIERRQDAEWKSGGLEYAADVVYSPDGAFAYAAEPDTDSFSAWRRDPDTAPEVPGGGGDVLEFMFRRAYGEQKLRFGGLEEAPGFGAAPVPVLTPALCGLKSFEVGGEDHLAQAAGCEDIALDTDTKANVTWQGGRADALIGMWDFTTSALYGDHSPGEFDEFGSLDWTMTPTGTGGDPTELTTCVGRWCLSAFEALGDVTCRPGYGCGYSRPALSLPNCREPGFGLSVYPATVANAAVHAPDGVPPDQLLPAALFPGPKCRSAPGALDWMAAPAPMSAVNFVVNNGRLEAMQFDGALNPGLFLTNDIRTLVDRDPARSKLPRERMSVEAWVTVDAQEYLAASDSEYRGAIMGAASGRAVSESSNPAGTCNKGWLLSYGLFALSAAGGGLSFRFQIAVEKNMGANGAGLFEVAEAFADVPAGCTCAGLGITGACSCFAGHWFHVVATYDGTFLDVFVNGELKRRKRACADAPCGGIVYPADYHPTDGAPTTACTSTGPVPVTIGNYTDRTSGGTVAHKGLIKEVSLFKRALAADEIAQRFRRHQELHASPVHWQRYWGKVPGISPSIDFFDASSLGGRGTTSFSVKGVFRSDSTYACVFVVDGAVNVSTPAVVQLASRALSYGGVAADNSLQMFGDADTVTCSTPEWHFGARVVDLAVLEDGVPLWQKVCLLAECGYAPLIARAATPTTHGWFFLTPSPADFRVYVPCPPDSDTCAHGVLSPSAHGSKTRFRFTVASGVWAWNSNAWVGEAPAGAVLVTSGGVGHTNGIVRHSKPAEWSDYDVYQLSWAVTATAGQLATGPATRVSNVGGGLFEPGFSALDWFVAFGPGCADMDQDCVETPQLGRVTEMYVHSPLNVSGCSRPGYIYGLDGGAGNALQLVAMYNVSDGRMTEITFATVQDRGRGYSSPPALNVSDPSCACFGAQDWSACITVVVNTLSATVSIEPQLGFQHVSNFGVAHEGVFGKSHCTSVAGCARDSRTNAVLGVSDIEVFDDDDGRTVVAAANYHDWERKEVNSSLFVLEPSTLEPVLVQQVETAAAVDVTALQVLGDHPLQLVGFANFHGPAMLYKWTGGVSVTAVHVESAGQGYVDGVVRVQSRLGGGFSGTFQAVGGEVQGVQVASGGAGYFPEAVAELYFAGGCAMDDGGCGETRMTGAVVAVEVRNASLLGNCSDGQILVDAQGVGQGLAARISISGSGAMSVVFPNASSHGSGYSPFDVTLVAQFVPPPGDPNATSACTCRGQVELGECLAPQVAWDGKLLLLPLHTSAVGISSVELVGGGAGYVPGMVSAVGHSGQGFRMAFMADGVLGAVSSLSLVNQGSGYFPETTVGLFYGPLCAFNDEECATTPMSGSISKVVISDPAGISGCAADGSITLVGGGGHGFMARFEALTRTGQMGRIFFVDARDHGAGYDPAQPWEVTASAASGCVCHGSSNLSACLLPWIASGAELRPLPQAELHPHYCPGGTCQDLDQRAFRHPWHPETESRMSVPLDLTRPFPLDAVGPVALEAFDMNGSTYLAVACNYDAVRDTARTPSKLFRLSSRAAGAASLVVTEVAALETTGARGVVHFEAAGLPGMHWLLFSQEGAESLLFASGGAQWQLVQRVPLRGGGRLLSFAEGVQTFVLAAERDADSSSLLRFNGSHLLGVQDTAVLPKDSAGGQRLPSARVVAFARWEADGVDYMLLGNGFNCSFAGPVPPPDCSRTIVFSSLFRQHVEDPLPLAGARSLAVTADGMFVYVAAYASNAVAGFRRDPTTGELYFSQAASYVAGATAPFYQVEGDQAGQQGGDFPVLQGVSSTVVSPDDRFLYAAAASEGAVYVFARNVTSGALSVIQVVRDGDVDGSRVIDSLAGANSLAVTTGSLYVAAQVDQAVSVLDRKADGTLRYVDRIRAGERMLTRFERPVVDDAAASWTNSSQPRRLHASHATSGNASLPGWLASARKTVSFEIDGVAYLAAAAGRDTPSGGTVAVYRWDDEDEAFVFVHDTGGRDPSPADVAYLVEDSGSLVRSFLVVANTEQDTHVYLWRAGRFLLYQTVPRTHPKNGGQIPPYTLNSGLPRCARSGAVHTSSTPVPTTTSMLSTPTTSNDTFVETPAGLTYSSEFLTVPLYTCIPTAMAQRVEVFKIDGTSYLGIAYVWDQPASQPYKWYSLVYRWNHLGFAVLEDGSQEEGFGFDMYQILPTSGATDMEFVSVPSWALGPSESAPVNLLVVANLLHASTAGSLEAESVVWRHRRDAWNPLLREPAGVFELLQTIPTKGAYGLHAFSVPYQPAPAGQVLLLGIASRQSGETDYTPASSLWAFVDTTTGFEEWQQLDDVYGATAMSALREGDEVHLIVSVACNASCQQFALTGNATRRRALLASGEAPVTRSTVLQWDQRTGRFAHPMALTDNEHLSRFGSPVPDAERETHSAAVLLPVPNMVHALPVRVGPVTLLALSSEEEGVVLMEWDLPRVPGLDGVNLVLPDPSDAGFLALGEVARALVFVKRASQVDSRNRTVSELTWVETVSEDPIAVDRLESSHAALVQGMAGGRRMRLHPPACSLVAPPCQPDASAGNATSQASNASNASNTIELEAVCTAAPACEFLLVHGGPPRHALPCGDAPPLSAVPPHLVVDSHIPARCFEPQVVVEVTETDNPLLFASAPAIVDGKLLLETVDEQFGTAEFVAFVNGSSFRYEFAVTVNPVRYPPTFEAMDVVVLEDAGVALAQFAGRIQTGRADASPAHLLKMHFELSFNASECPHLVPEPASPWTGTVYVAAGEGYGALRFEWARNRWGNCTVSAVLVDPEEIDPDAQRSEPVDFQIRVLPVNDPPLFNLRPFVDVEQGAPETIVPEFVYADFSVGSYENLCKPPDEEHGSSPCFCRDGVYLYEPHYPCRYAFTLSRVEKRVAGGEFVDDDQVLFERFDIDYAGRLSYGLDPGRFGTFRLTIRMQDDGGSKLGGVDEAFRTVALTVVQQIEPPGVEGYTQQQYRPLLLPRPLPAPEEHSPLDDFASVPLGNVTAINLTVPEMHFEVPQVYDDFLTHFVNGPPDQEAANRLNLTVVAISNDVLFSRNNQSECTGCPRFYAGGRMGSLAFQLVPFAFGVSTVQIELLSVGEHGSETSVFDIDIIVLPVNNAPTAMLPAFLGVVENSGLMEIPLFATNISVGPPNEQWQAARFAVQTEVDTPLLLQGSPRVSHNGTLTLNLTADRHGEGVLTVMLTDSGGTLAGGQDAAPGFPRSLPLKVFPLPRIVTVSPCVGPVSAGWTVTVYGQYFGSQYSRNTPWGGNVSAYDDVEVRVDGAACARQVLVSDTQLLCDMPAGRGRKTLQVFVPGGAALNANGQTLSHWNRTGTFFPGVVQADLYYAGGATGVTSTEEAGLIAFGPDMSVTRAPACAPNASVEGLPGADNRTAAADNSTGSDDNQTCRADGPLREPASLSVVPGVGLTRSVRAIMPFQDRVVLGGSFLSGSGAGRHLSYLVSWDGSKLAALAGGVDGTVYSLNRWGAWLVVGGAFSLLYGDQARGQQTLKSGGLGLWDGQAWSVAGGAAVDGAVTCTHVQGGTLFVAGRFRQIGNATASNIARLEGGRWAALGEGLRARDVLAMAGSERDLFVAGDISIAGAVQVGNVARWLVVQEEWRPMKEFNGVVRALALVGNRLFVGGDFSLAGILPAGAVAQADVDGSGEVEWKEAGGIGGSIHAMLYSRGCLYVGGRFDSVAGRHGVLAARNAARWCLEGAAEFGETWEPVVGMGGQGGQVLAIAAAAGV